MRAPFAVVADLVSTIHTIRLDVETLAWGLPTVVLAKTLDWARPVPLLLAQRYGTAFKTIGAGGLVRPAKRP